MDDEEHAEALEKDEAEEEQAEDDEGSFGPRGPMEGDESEETSSFGCAKEVGKVARQRKPRRRFIPFRNCCNDAACSGKEAEKEWSKPKALPRPSTEKIKPLITKEPQGVKTIGEDTWVQIDVQVDSGATETVMAESTLQGVIDITEGPAFKRGVTYEVANGAEIPNLGERKFLGCMEDGTARAITAQVCSVNQTLMSVSKIASKGNRVVFDDDGSYIEEKATGSRTWMTQVGGMYSLKMWVSRKSTKEAGF